ncbi:hypothetical protein [Nostoc sp.]|uniref:hypothetical protein n=1 Tax=Nostoc sp. TaxID=1180 RepID=UPI003FA53F53
MLRGSNHYPQDIELTVEQSHPALRSSASAAFSVEVEGAEQLVVACEVERSYLRNLESDEVTLVSLLNGAWRSRCVANLS